MQSNTKNYQQLLSAEHLASFGLRLSDVARAETTLSYSTLTHLRSGTLKNPSALTRARVDAALKQLGVISDDHDSTVSQ